MVADCEGECVCVLLTWCLRLHCTWSFRGVAYSPLVFPHPGVSQGLPFSRSPFRLEPWWKADNTLLRLSTTFCPSNSGVGYLSGGDWAMPLQSDVVLRCSCESSTHVGGQCPQWIHACTSQYSFQSSWIVPSSGRKPERVPACRSRYGHLRDRQFKLQNEIRGSSLHTFQSVQKSANVQA